jgi:hypothetical protein
MDLSNFLDKWLNREKDGGEEDGEGQATAKLATLLDCVMTYNILKMPILKVLAIQRIWQAHNDYLQEKGVSEDMSINIVEGSQNFPTLVYNQILDKFHVEL